MYLRSSSAIERASDIRHHDAAIAIAYFYCAFDNAPSQELVNVLGSIAAQLGEKQPDLLLRLETIFKEATKGATHKRLSTSESELYLLNYFESFSRVFLFVDALNESTQCASISSSLANLARSASNVSIIFTSTPEALTKELENLQNLVTISLASKDILEDVEMLVDASLRSKSNLRDLRADLQDEIRSSLINKADGMDVLDLLLSDSALIFIQVSLGSVSD
jgi:hypothetical protein